MNQIYPSFKEVIVTVTQGDVIFKNQILAPANFDPEKYYRAEVTGSLGDVLVATEVVAEEVPAIPKPKRKPKNQMTPKRFWKEIKKLIKDIDEELLEELTDE